jgi:hypothetical protein
VAAKNEMSLQPKTAVLPAARDTSTKTAAPTDARRLAAVAALLPLWMVRYRIRLVPRAPLVLPLFNRGTILRGAFGLHLRRLVCHDMDLACRTCPLEPTCPYPATFEPRPPADSDRLSTFSDLPRPFVFDPPTDEKTEFHPGEPVTFGLTAIGRASRLVPYFVSALRNLADEGLGPRRARFVLDEVVAVGVGAAQTAVYRSTEALVRLSAPTLRAAHLLQGDDARRTRLTLRFVTPTDIKDGGAAVRTPLFGALMRRLRDRANSLSCFFADGPLELDFKGMSAAAETVHLAEDRTRPAKCCAKAAAPANGTTWADS